MTRLHILIFFLLIIIVSSCKKDSTPAKPKTTDIYVAGMIYNLDGTSTAVYWKNGEMIKLHAVGRLDQAFAIGLQGDDVYCLGYTPDNENSSIAWWKNGVAQKLEGATEATYPRDLVVKGNDVYLLADVAIYSTNTPVKWVPTVWKNGVPTGLTDGTGYANSSGMAFKGNDLYVTGHTIDANGKVSAVLWKNGTLIKLSDGSASATANAITVVGNDVYVAGIGASSKFSVGLVWKNQGVADSLVNNAVPYDFTAHITGIAVNGNDVYVAGSETDRDVQMFGFISWKNGVMPRSNSVSMSSSTGSGQACFYNNSFYVAGTISGHACYWKDQQPVLLSNQSSPSGAADILIVEH